MHSQKITISIPQSLFDFVELYQSEHHIKSRSDVFSAALHLLQQQQLEACYAEANEELNNDFDATLNDGLDNESW
jgi:antitoxin ParD1/3/4